MSGHYFDDEREIDLESIMVLRKVLADLMREMAGGSTAEEELVLARELIALFKSGFRSEEELKTMARDLPEFHDLSS
jgi:hypothetical protein